MTRSATATIDFKAAVTVRNTLDDGTQASAPVGGVIVSDSLEDGVSANEVNRVWFGEIDIPSGTFTDIDLNQFGNRDIGAGVAKDALGIAMDVEEIVLLVIKNKSGSAGILNITETTPSAANVVWVPDQYADASNGGGIREGGFRVWYEPSTNGLNITQGSSSAFRLSAEAGQGDCTAQIYVVARNDDDESSSSSNSSSSLSSESSS